MLKNEFNELYKLWQEEIKKPEVSFSSNPNDYTRLESYRRIEGLGKAALPFVVEKIKDGDFLMNSAAFKIAGISVKQLMEREEKKSVQKRMKSFAEVKGSFPTEQQKSMLILANLNLFSE